MPRQSLLDTDILSEYLKGHDATVVDRGTRYAREHGVFTFSSITVFEILFGLEFKGATSHLAKAQAWFSQNEEVAPLVVDFRTAATIKATASRQGSIVELPDCLIAAIAVRPDRSLVTGNTDDFRAIQLTGIKLSIENWREAASQ